MKMIQSLESRRDLLEYDLPSTSEERKNKIIDDLYKRYCGLNLNFNPPFFAREKRSKDGIKDEKKNNTPLELTEKMINDAVENDLKRNEKDKIYKIKNAPLNKRNKIFIELIDKKEYDLCHQILGHAYTVRNQYGTIEIIIINIQ